MMNSTMPKKRKQNNDTQLLRRLTTLVVDIKEGQEGMDRRLRRLEDITEKSFRKLDAFLTLVKKQESELAALRHMYERLENRVIKLESRH